MNTYDVKLTFSVTMKDIRAKNVSDAIDYALVFYDKGKIAIDEAIVSSDSLDAPVSQRVGNR